MITLTRKPGEREMSYGGKPMDKEEILERSRRENVDEGMIDALNRGNRLGIIICTAVFSFFAIFNAVFDRNNDHLYAMYVSYIVAEAYEKYRFTGKKKLLMWSAFGILVMLLFSIHYIGEVVSVL